MLLWICKISFLSFLLIFLLHYLYTFFLQNLTSPKIKDLINRPNEQYNNIMSSINRNAIQPHSNGIVQPGIVHPGIDSTDSNVKMKDELKQFLTSEMSNNKQPPAYERDNSLIFSQFDK
jgi:hypothetical protein